MVKEKAFIGVSLDSTYFSRAWVRNALNLLSKKYKSVLIILADDVLKFTRTATTVNDSVVLDFATAESYVIKRRQEVSRFFDSEISKLSTETKSIVKIGQWSLFIDENFFEFHRKLRIAYETVTSFRIAVDAIARKHAELQKSTGLDKKMLANLNTNYIIEESAMCLRITEIEGYADEFHPSDDLPVMPQLYSGAFADYGLTVKSITGVQPRRNFSILKFEES